jgi:hypothetical protein
MAQGTRVFEMNDLMTKAREMTAELPVIYSEARNALAKCARIDECKGWADRAAALASYAKQADDDQLLNNAKRIKARAIDRIGELAEEIPPGSGGQPFHSTRGDVPPSRIQAARDAGISPDQLKTALRVHNVPRDEFERQVESDDPPTITELARQGTRSRPEAADVFNECKAVIDGIASGFHDSGKARHARVVGPMISGEQLKAACIVSTLREINRIESEIESVLPDEVHLCDLLRQVRGELMRIQSAVGG